MHRSCPDTRQTVLCIETRYILFSGKASSVLDGLVTAAARAYPGLPQQHLPPRHFRFGGVVRRDRAGFLFFFSLTTLLSADTDGCAGPWISLDWWFHATSPVCTNSQPPTTATTNTPSFPAPVLSIATFSTDLDGILHGRQSLVFAPVPRRIRAPSLSPVSLSSQQCC